MALEIIDTRYGETTKTLQDTILLVLAKEYPLTIGEVTKRLRKDFKVTVTFQAVRKSLKTLVDRKVLVEEKKVFSVNKNYVLELRHLSDQLIRNYFIGERKDKLPTWSSVGEEHTSYTFENLLQTDKFWGEVVLDWARNLKQSDDRKFCFHGPHCWYPLGHLGTESDFLLELKDHNVQSYYLVEMDTLLDQWTKQFYNEHGVKYVIKPKRKQKPMNTAMGIFGDFIIQFDYPKDIYKQMEEFYQDSASLNKTNITTIARLLKKKAEIKLMVMKNKTIATKLKSEIISFFNKKP